MAAYEEATSRPMLDLRPTTDDQQRFETNVLPGGVSKFMQKQSYLQPPALNAMYDAEKQMQEIMEAPQLTAAEKRKLYSDQLNRFLTFKNKPDFPAHPIAKASVQEAAPTPVEMTQLNEPADVTSRVPATPKPNFLTPPATEEERPKLKHNFFHNWVDSLDWRPKDM